MSGEKETSGRWAVTLVQTRDGETPQHRPRKFFAGMKIFCICAVQYGSHEPHAAIEH